MRRHNTYTLKNKKNFCFGLFMLLIIIVVLYGLFVIYNEEEASDKLSVGNDEISGLWEAEILEIHEGYILIDLKTDAYSSGMCEVTITNETILFVNGVEDKLFRLNVGQTIYIKFQGMIMESHPLQGSAAEIRIVED